MPERKTMINFVIGPTCSGKSAFIRNTFDNALVIDLLGHQKDYACFNVENAMQSYEDTRSALIEAIKDGNHNIVLEHTMLKKNRRIDYIKSIREVTDEAINCYVLRPSYKDYGVFCRKRGATPNSLDYNLLEIPKKEEGFENVYVIIPVLSEEAK